MIEVSREALINRFAEILGSDDASLATIRVLVDLTKPLNWDWYPVPTFCGSEMRELIWEVGVGGRGMVELDVRLTKNRKVWVSRRSQTTRLGGVDLADITMGSLRRKKSLD